MLHAWLLVFLVQRAQASVLLFASVTFVYTGNVISVKFHKRNLVLHGNGLGLYSVKF